MASTAELLMDPSPEDEDERWLVETQEAEPQQPWIVRAECGSEEGAREEAAALELERRGAGPGTLVRLRRLPEGRKDGKKEGPKDGGAEGRQEGRAELLGLIDASGRLVPAPPLSPLAQRPPASDWLAVWEGPRAEAPWMLRAAALVDRPSLVRAAAACARTATEAGVLADRPLRKALGVVEAWAWSRGTLAQVRAVRPDVQDVVRLGGLAAQRAAWAVLAALDTALAEPGREVGGRAEDAALMAGYKAARGGSAGPGPGPGGAWDREDARAFRRMAPLVRDQIPLGAVLRSYLDLPRDRFPRTGPRSILRP